MASICIVTSAGTLYTGVTALSTVYRIATTFEPGPIPLPIGTFNANPLTYILSPALMSDHGTEPFLEKDSLELFGHTRHAVGAAPFASWNIVLFRACPPAVWKIR